MYSYEAGFSHYKASVGYGGSVGGHVLFGLTYLLDLVLVADIIVSMKKALVTPTGERKASIVPRHLKESEGVPGELKLHEN